MKRKPKLVITIPAYNEEATIEQVIREIPKKIKGIDKIQVLVIDDGSTDRTAEKAKRAGAVVLSNKKNIGLARTFKRALQTALSKGADIIVNTDADFQYNQKQIPELLEPILKGKADIVLGSRFQGHIEYMPFSKRIGNRISTWAVRRVSGLPISDAQTGFRAFTRESALRMNILSTHTYTQETIIQAAAQNLVITEVPVEFRRRDGPSRLIQSVWGYAKRVSFTLIIGYLNYKPLRIFLGIGLLFFLVGFSIGIRVLYHFLLTGQVSPFIPSTILTAILLIFGFQIIMIGLLAEMIKNKRQMVEEILYHLRRRSESV